MFTQKQAAKTSLPSLVVLLIFTLIVAGIVIFRQELIDTVRASQFTPSSEISDIKADLNLTERASFMFDASHPVLQTSDEFNVNCNQKSETNNPILGCYTMQSIYIYDITNPKLEGIEQTTAAHELLHAFYERLPQEARADLDAKLSAAYERLKTPELEERMDHYRETEPGQESNELHSILPTEFDDLGPDLEAYYKSIFMNRSKVVAYNKQYSGAFTEISNRLNFLASTINDAVERINMRIKEHNRAVKELEADQAAFVQKNRNGEFTSTASFNAEQQALNARAAQLNAERDQISAEINQSNELRDEYNALVEEYNELNQSINSSLAPTPSLEG